MSKRWKKITTHKLEASSKFDRLKNWVPDFGKKFVVSKHVLNVFFNPDFYFYSFPLCLSEWKFAT